MTNHKPFILISNDDGYNAPGIRHLVDFLKPVARLLVCAPDGPRSGFSRAFSAATPLVLKRQYNMPDVEVYSCNGTPVDCVKLALSQLCGDRRPDLIIGGINHGDNSTVNCHYSGTMGVAVEGCLKGINAIAFSSCYYNEDANLMPLQPWVVKIVRQVLEKGLPAGVCLNVNFPATEVFKGVKVCRMTKGDWQNEVYKQRHPRGYNFYWMVGNYANHEPDAADSDQWALANGWISITPTTIDVTAYDAISDIQGWNL